MEQISDGAVGFIVAGPLFVILPLKCSIAHGLASNLTGGCREILPEK